MKRSYTINIPVGVFWKVVVPGIFLLAVLGSVGGVIVIDRVVMPNVVGVNRDVVTVPGVERLPYEEAREVFYKVGLLTEIQGREYDDSIGIQAVISQSPIAGARVKKGRKIALVVSRGKEVAMIPDVRNVTERQARILMKKAGFTVENVKKVYSEKRPVDYVVDAFPKSGTTTSREIDVGLFVSKGPRPTHAKVPNLVGESLKNAKRLITENGLITGSVSYQNNPSLLPGTIISQSAAPGSKVPLESKLNLVVSVIR